MSVDRQEALLVKVIRTALHRIRDAGRSGLIDPEYRETDFANPRFQEICLTLAASVKLQISLPDDIMDVDLDAAASRAVAGWLGLVQRDGGVRYRPDYDSDPQATAFGAFAVTRALILLGDRAPAATIERAGKILKKTARFLLSSPVTPGLESLPVRFAAIRSIAEWYGDDRLHRSAEKLLADSERTIRNELDRSGYSAQDAGGLALALAILTLMVREPNESRLKLWRDICRRCLLSTMENGFFGGGAEVSLASLPLSAGFEIIADTIPEAAEMVRRLDYGWEAGLYDSMLDDRVPWLTPMTHLVAFGLAARRGHAKLAGGKYEPLEGTGEYGEGLLQVEDWRLRLGCGGTIGWMFHQPSDSTRVFGSPVGLALREGPWKIVGTRLYHPAFAGSFPSRKEKPWSVDGALYSVPIPGMERPPRGIGFPRTRGRRRRDETRLVPPFRPIVPFRAASLQYKREIELEGGALAVETTIAGRLTHRLPIIWPGGHFGSIRVDKQEYPPSKSWQVRHAREIVIGGGPWPEWIVRTDLPVDLYYEPIHGPITTHPMRFLSVAAGTLDIIATDRLHLAWRVAG